MTGNARLGMVLCLILAPVALPRAAPAQAPSSRDASLRAICARLGIGPDRTVADVGCGSGSDSFIFASIVGEKGTVLAEEIVQGNVDAVRKGAQERKLPQVVPVLGKTEDPGLPDGRADLIYMHYVYHHFSRPASMLRNMWLDLKPGGYMVIVEKGKGPLQDWASVDVREKQHHLIGETTVVRQCREEGFEFTDVLDDLWHDRSDFALAFRRPLDGTGPAGDPDLPSPLDARALLEALPLDRSSTAAVAVIALDRGRAALPAIADSLGARARIFDVVLGEWAVAKDEVPPNPAGVRVEVLRTEGGSLQVPEGVLFDAVVFVDAYHRLWDPTPLLARLRKSLAPGGFLAILDRKGPDGEPRRLAGHRRRISPALARLEVEMAGFREPLEGKPPAPDRFVLIFRPHPKKRWV